MGAAGVSLDEAHLSRFSPLDTLHPDLLAELRRHARIERFPPGKCLFNREARGGEAMFLLSGQLALVVDGRGAVTLRADSAEARRPVAHEAVSVVTALARTSVTILFVDTAVLDGLLRRSGEAQSVISPASEPPVTVTAVIEPPADSVLLDVRSPRSYARRHPPGSINFPLHVLRHAAFTLDRSRSYIICGDGRRAQTAAELLARHGLSVSLQPFGAAAAYPS